MMAFVHIRKTAGTSLIAMLRNSFGAAHLEVRTLDLRYRASNVFATRELRARLPPRSPARPSAAQPW